METHIIDITKEHCPMTFVKTKLALSKLNKGDRLEILLSKGEPIDNVPKSCEEQGYKIIAIEKITEEIFKVIIEK